jgi:pimeloyl-ACP methyl ester carboxylesterase
VIKSPSPSVVSLKGDRHLLAAWSRAPRKTRRWVVFLPESGSEFRQGDRRELAGLIGAGLAKKFHFLVINKPGLGPEGVDKAMFEKSFRRERRIEDALRVLKELIPAGDRIYLVGYSEGAYLAPPIARREKRVKAVVMIGGGTRGWLKEELSNAGRREKPAFEKKIREIYRQPKSLKKWNGFSYATWYSYRGDTTLKALRDVRVPMLAILGARDRVIDLKTTIVDLMLVSEHQPIQLHVFGDCGHYFSKHWKPVSRVLERFLADLA